MFIRFISFIAALCILTIAQASQTAGFVLFFQPLYEMPPSSSQAYIKEFRSVLQKYPSANLDPIILRSYRNDICAKKKIKTCVHGLYKINSCVSPKKVAAQLCSQKNGRHNTTHYFQESVFNRLNWNHFALQISRICQKTQDKTCVELSKVHKKYFNIYRKFIKNRKKNKKKEWDI